MAHVDYEAAWLDLSERLRNKPGWGAREVIEVMAELAAKHRLPENFLQRMVRLYGDSIHIQITPETGAAVLDESELTAESKSPDPEASTTQGGHDERAAAGEDDPAGIRAGRSSSQASAGRDGQARRSATPAAASA